MLKWLIFIFFILGGGARRVEASAPTDIPTCSFKNMPPLRRVHQICPAPTRERGIWPPMDDEEAKFLLEDEHEKVGQPLSFPPPLFVYFRAFAVLVSIGTTAPVALPRALVYMQSARL